MEIQVINATEYRNVPLSLLNESKTNPRRIFGDAALRELAAYVPGHIIQHYVPQAIMWPLRREAAWLVAVRVLKGT